MGKHTSETDQRSAGVAAGGPRIFQLRVSLDGIEPPIYRRLQVNDHSLAALHKVLQSAMGWEDCHLHSFQWRTRTGSGAFRDPQAEHRREVRTTLSQLAAEGNTEFRYHYDFGDDWFHTIVIEHVGAPEPGVVYPRCIEGARACPPEDYGGVYSYQEFLDELAASPPSDASDDEHDADNGDGEDDDWDDPDFDPEHFDLPSVNRELLALRVWWGDEFPVNDVRTRWAESERVRVRAGAVHPQYADLPIGGWVGIVDDVARVTPPAYHVRWSEETLAQVHGVYFRRCERDEWDAEYTWLDEQLLEPAGDAEPVVEPPTAIVTRPLSADDLEDRVRAVFGLTSDDAVPIPGADTARTYYEYLKDKLTFPIQAEPPQTAHTLTLLGLLPADAIDDRGIQCRVRDDQQEEVWPLADLAEYELKPLPDALDDYLNWWYPYAEPPERDDEEEREDWVPAPPPGFVVPTLAPFPDPLEPPEPIRRPSKVGRNDPCPCGSGKKYKKCCWKADRSAADDL
jgi:hypothetical protein